MPSRKEILAREVAEKLRLEALVKPGIRKIFNRVVDDFRVAVARTGQPQEVSRYRKSFETLLEEHYRRVQKAFSGMILQQNNVLTFGALRAKQGKAADEDESKIKELIAAIFLLWDDQHAPVQAGYIVDTTARDMDDAISQGRQALQEEGKPVDNRSLAAAAAAILKRILRGRVDLIAVTETQTAAETAKAIEASTAARILIPGIPLPRDIVPLLEPTVAPTPAPGAGPRLTPVQAVLKKSWIDLRDNKVRATHREAGRRYGAQAIPVNEAFIVGSSRMMYPGDTSLGAPVREIAHCRCSAQYIF
jgi:hypothetical protein